MMVEIKFICLLALGFHLGADGSQRPMDSMADLTNDLGVRILQIVSTVTDGNIAFSPYGVASVTILLFEGSNGNTALEILQTLNLPWNTLLARVGFRDINRHLKTYFKSDGFLRGLIMSRDEVCFHAAYQKLLRLYGFEEPDKALTYPCAGFVPYSPSTSSTTEAVTISSPGDVPVEDTTLASPEPPIATDAPDPAVATTTPDSSVTTVAADPSVTTVAPSPPVTAAPEPPIATPAPETTTVSQTTTPAVDNIVTELTQTSQIVTFYNTTFKMANITETPLVMETSEAMETQPTVIKETVTSQNTISLDTGPFITTKDDTVSQDYGTIRADTVPSNTVGLDTITGKIYPSTIQQDATETEMRTSVQPRPNTEFYDGTKSVFNADVTLQDTAASEISTRKMNSYTNVEDITEAVAIDKKSTSVDVPTATLRRENFDRIKQNTISYLGNIPNKKAVTILETTDDGNMETEAPLSEDRTTLRNPNNGFSSTTLTSLSYPGQNIPAETPNPNERYKDILRMLMNHPRRNELINVLKSRRIEFETSVQNVSVSNDIWDDFNSTLEFLTEQELDDLAEQLSKPDDTDDFTALYNLSEMGKFKRNFSDFAETSTDFFDNDTDNFIFSSETFQPDFSSEFPTTRFDFNDTRSFYNTLADFIDNTTQKLQSLLGISTEAPENQIAPTVPANKSDPFEIERNLPKKSISEFNEKLTDDKKTNFVNVVSLKHRKLVSRKYNIMGIRPQKTMVKRSTKPSQYAKLCEKYSDKKSTLMKSICNNMKNNSMKYYNLTSNMALASPSSYGNGSQGDVHIRKPRSYGHGEHLWFSTYDGRGVMPAPAFVYSALLPFAYIDDLKAKVLELPLDDRRYSLLLILPMSGYGLPHTLNGLLTWPLRKIHRQLRPFSVFAVVPKFRVVSHIDLKPALYRMGIHDVFYRYRADLSVMSPDARLYVRSVEQVVTIYVDKFSDTVYEVPEKLTDKYFEASTPFLYFVLDKESKVSLVAGIMADPSIQNIRLT